MFAVTFYDTDGKARWVYDDTQGIDVPYAIYETVGEAQERARKWNNDNTIYHVVPASVLYDIEEIPPTKPTYKVEVKRP